MTGIIIIKYLKILNKRLKKKYEKYYNININIK